MRVTVGPGDDIAALVRATDSESVLVLLSPELDKLAMVQARAAIRPLAIECAPRTRVNAVLAMAGAYPDDVKATARFLESARSTTGQVLEVGPRD